MSNDKALATTGVSAIAPWADRGDVRELAERLQKMMPGAKALTPPEALSLAQASLAHGLDPFNGELWWIPGSGLMAGIKGLRRGAHRELEKEGGGNYWPEYEQLDVDEKTALGIPPDALAFRCKIRDTQTVNHYVSEIERLLAAKVPWEVVEQIVGSRPYTEGVGYAEKRERSKMTLVQRAMKRAEADALKRRFDLPFGASVGISTDSNATVVSEFVTEEQGEPETPEQTLAKNRAILHGEDDDILDGVVEDAEPESVASAESGPEWDAEKAAAITWAMAQGVYENGYEATASLDKCQDDNAARGMPEISKFFRVKVAAKQRVKAAGERPYKPGGTLSDLDLSQSRDLLASLEEKDDAASVELQNHLHVWIDSLALTG